MKKALVVCKIHLKQSKLAYLITLICCVSNLISAFVNYCIGLPDDGSISVGNMLFLSLILSAVFIPSLHYRKLMNLNVKKKDYFYGSLYTYILLSAVLSALNLLVFFTLDRLFTLRTQIMNIADIFGWIDHGIVFAFLQQFAFLLLLAVVIHTLTSLQTSWVGWTIDLILAAIISVFTPILVLRVYLLRFFDLIIFNNSPILQIGICLLLAAVIYALNLPILKRKRI